MIEYQQLRDGLGYMLGTDYNHKNIISKRQEIDISKLDYSIQDDNGNRVPLSWIAVDNIQECIGGFIDDLNTKFPDELLDYIAKLEVKDTEVALDEKSISPKPAPVGKENAEYLQRAALTRQKFYFEKDTKPVVLKFD